MTAPFAMLEQRMASAVTARLSNVVARTANSAFSAQFDIDTTEYFDGTKGADFTLRYQGPNLLARGEVLTVEGSPLVAANVELQVYEKPRAIGSGHEFIALLVRAA